MTEFMSGNGVVIAKNMKEEAIISCYGAAVNADKKKKKKKRGAFGIFRAALHMLRKKPEEKEAKKAMNEQKNKDSNWKMLVESMRPLHLQETPQSTMHPPMYQPDSAETEELIFPASPAASSSFGTLSQYASAQNLRELDKSDDEEKADPDEVFDAITGDEMIDAKADEFISQFYRQIQLQNSTLYAHKDRGI